MGRLNQLLTLAQGRARELKLPYEGALTPAEAHEVMSLVPHARLVDVRTKAELDWVGRVPNAIEIEWQSYPGAALNPHFLDVLKHTVTTDNMLLFLCRSGVRSSAAAKAASEAGFPDCYNVLEGFEGDKDASGKRKTVGGWCAADLPWQQG
jgi:rhodanese-related sulfurtransferase